MLPSSHMSKNNKHSKKNKKRDEEAYQESHQSNRQIVNNQSIRCSVGMDAVFENMN